MADDHGHIPVLLDRCVELLMPALTRRHPDGTGAVLVDATLGAGGHAERFLRELPGLRLIGLDRDPDALRIAGERLAPFGDRVMLVRTRYDGIEGALAESGFRTTEVDGILFDLGVSSMQLDRTERGFSYATDAPLDMRMDPDSTLTAAEVVNTYDEKDAHAGAARIRRGALREPYRRAHRPPPRPPAVHDHRRAGGAAVRGDPGAGPPHRRAPGQAHVPGAAHRRQRRTGFAARRAPRGTGGLEARRADRGDGLSVAGGPHRQESVRRRDGLPHTARAAGRTARARAGIRVADPRCRACRPRRDRDRIRAAPRCGCGHWKRLCGRDNS